MAFRNRVKFTTATTGTGSVTVGAASSGFQTPASSGVADGEIVNYAIEDGAAWETGVSQASSTATVFTRVLEQSSTAALLNLTGSAVMFFTPTAAKLGQMSVRGKMLQLSIGNVLQ